MKIRFVGDSRRRRCSDHSRIELTRAPTGVWANFALTGGAYPPPPQRSPKLCVLARIKKALESSCQALQYLNRSFWGQVNIEVTRGHQRPILPNPIFFSQKCVIISGSILVRRPRKKAFDSSWAVLSLAWHQIWATINSSRARDNKQPFLPKTFFANNFWTEKAGDLIRVWEATLGWGMLHEGASTPLSTICIISVLETDGASLQILS